MKILCWTFLFSFWAEASLFSQRTIEIKYQADAKGNYVFSCVNNAFCDYILRIGFTSLENGRCDHGLPYEGEVKPGNNALFTLIRLNADSALRFKYTTSSLRGCLTPRPDTSFTYVLPISTGKEAQAYVMNSDVKSSQGALPSRDGYVIRLKMKPGDTIFASRRGVVSAVEDGNGQNDAGVASAGYENYIEINHADCSFGHYGILRKSSSLVKPGQTVEAGQAIGLVGGDPYGRGSEARFSVFYNSYDQGTETWFYIPLQFWTKTSGRGNLKQGADYICEKPPAILSQELKKPAVKKEKPKRK
jgi:hypothetical protein